MPQFSPGKRKEKPFTTNIIITIINYYYESLITTKNGSFSCIHSILFFGIHFLYITFICFMKFV